MSWSLPIAAVMAALVGWSGLGQAQAQTPGQQYKDWRYECREQPASGSTPAGRICLIQHEVRNGKNLLLAARVRIMGAQKQVALLFFLPPTLGAKAPIGFAIDQGAMATTEVRQCSAQFCWAAVPVGDNLLAAMKAGGALTVVVKPGAGESRLVVSLAGFTGAFTALQATAQ